MKYGFFFILAGAGLLLVFLIGLSVSLGVTAVAFRDVSALFLGGGGDIALPIRRIIFDLRLPRALFAIFIGGGLGIVGALMQTVTRNDLADPFLFGLSSGAAAGAVFTITVLGDIFGVWTLPLTAFIGGMLSAFTVLLLVNKMRNRSSENLILAGLAVSFIFTALTNYMIFSGDQRAAHAILFWNLGGLGLARWHNLGLCALGFFIIFITALMMHRKLDGLLAGENTAESLGISVKKMRGFIFLICAFSTALFVSLSGVIGFVGLMIPHMVRPISGPLHFRLILFSGVAGAILLISSDILARVILSPQELPIGIVTSSVGAFFVLFLLVQRH